MKREVLNPGSRDEWLRARVEDVTSTESPALFGISPYQTKFELWHRKKSKMVVDSELTSERVKWGTRLQDSIAKGIAEDMGWQIRRMDEYIREPDFKMGASFDYAIEDDKEPGILEIKNVDSLMFRENWIIESENIEAPPHIELQLQHQLAVSKRYVGYIGALIGGNKVILIRRNADDKIILNLKIKIAEFWKSIETNHAPEPDFSRDSEFIRELYSNASSGKVLDLSSDETISALAKAYAILLEEEKQVENRKNAIKAKLLMASGDAEKIIGNGFTISCGMIEACPIEAYIRKGYRNFRINLPRVKKIKPA